MGGRGKCGPAILGGSLPPSSPRCEGELFGGRQNRYHVCRERNLSLNGFTDSRVVEEAKASRQISSGSAATPPNMLGREGRSK